MRCPTLQELPPPPPGKTGWPWTEESPRLPDKSPDGKSWPRISIVTPSYNQGQFIEETIRSVLLQGYPDLEYIVIDGGSKDGAVDVINKYKDWLAYCVIEQDHGQANAINKGFTHASGDVYAYLNSDDFYERGALSLLATEYRTSGDAKRFWLASCVTDFSDAGSKVVVPPCNLELRDWVSNIASIHQPGTFWSSALWDEVGGFDEQYGCAFDRKFFMELVARGCSPRILNQVTAHFRVHSQSKTGLEIIRNIDGGIFVGETLRISKEFMRHLKLHERFAVRKYLRQKEMSRALWIVNHGSESNALKVFVSRSFCAFSSVVMTRFFWGTCKKLLIKKLRAL